MAKLEDWKLHATVDADGKTFQFLTGKVYGHPKADIQRENLVDGHFVRTSRLVCIDIDAKTAVTQSGTVYLLGENTNPV